jgi:hypothetical protein
MIMLVVCLVGIATGCLSVNLCGQWNERQAGNVESRTVDLYGTGCLC